MARILVITNSRELGAAIASELRRMDQMVTVADRASALDTAFECSPEMLVVDASEDSLPGRICRQIRQENELKDLPLVALIAEAHLSELSPKIGIDDFIVMPARPGEMAARIRQALWRINRAVDEDLLKVRDMVINLASYEVTVRGSRVVLTYKEFELLKFLAMNPGRVYTRENLLNRVWGFDFYGGTRTVDVHIRRLRAKIGDQHESLIQTVRNVGYRFSDSLRTELEAEDTPGAGAAPPPAEVGAAPVKEKPAARGKLASRGL